MGRAARGQTRIQRSRDEREKSRRQKSGEGQPAEENFEGRNFTFTTRHCSAALS